MRDGWRDTYPTKKCFTFLQNGTNSQSRIDRIYLKTEMLNSTRGWKVKPVGLPGLDHNIIMTQITCEDAPAHGKGRWSLDISTLNDKTLRTFIQERGEKAESDAILASGPLRSEEFNPQRILHRFTKDILAFAREREKIIKSKWNEKERNLEKQLDTLMTDDSVSQEELKSTSAKIKNDMKMLAEEKHTRTQKRAAAKNRLDGEALTKYWTRSNKTEKP
ncbi:hypothetical protein EV421DRAFT_1723050 [Armillaria borealis]|uniref:Uncharacterized protein n=1 Tax=Armillaria borealis TaxID=47425 RepID=A0AA39ISJ0_9AGAR|nr:hypothetical protein EV421DRAFT_1723050 [Armillaria borealis]